MPTSPLSELTPEQIQSLLDRTDWSSYWCDVAERVNEGCEQYERASAATIGALR
jgi:hypothetical protein